MGSSTSEAAWAMEPVPRPASLEKMPRDTPFFIHKNRLPTAPPVTAEGLKAPLRIMASTPGTRFRFSTSTPRAMVTYTRAIKGTNFSATLPMRFKPPTSTIATSRAMPMPIPRLTLFRAPAEETRLKFTRAVSMAVTMALTWVALPVPKTVKTPSTA